MMLRVYEFAVWTTVLLVILLLGLLAGCGGGGVSSGSSEPQAVISVFNEDGVPLYRVFQRDVTNTAHYGNKFTDVSLHVEYTSPSGRKIAFAGFYDGDGEGGQSGNVWKIRFMPDEVGTYRYTYSWSDGKPGGSGEFTAIGSGAGRGILKAYAENPHWFAYNGKDAVFLKSYKVGAAGFTGTPIDWAASNVYSKLADRGYNHIQLKSLPIGWAHEKPADAPADHLGSPLWQGTPTVQDLQVWKRLDEHIGWLNTHGINVHFFMGFDPKGDGSSMHGFAQIRFANLSAADQEFYVRYITARLAPFANVAGWNYTWETDGNGAEQRLMDLLAKYDPWKHLATYHDEAPASNDFGNPRYSFAGIENHGYFGNSGGAAALDSASHYQATMDAFRDKPVYMAEGNGLWRGCWAKDNANTSATRAAWAVTLAGGSFGWQDASGCSDGPIADMLNWPAGDPVAKRLDVLYGMMTEEVAFERMTPHNELLSGCWNSFDRNGAVPTAPCYALAEVGKQYVVYKESGGSFSLSLASGQYSATWVDTRSGARQPANGGAINSGGSVVQFFAPSTSTDWVLLLQGS
jgi:hypothetical protein